MKNFLKLSAYISALMVIVQSPDLRAQSVAVVPASVWVAKFNANMGQSVNNFTQTTAFNFLNGQVVSEQVTIGGQFTILNLKPDNQGGLFNVEVAINKAQATAKDLQINITIEQDLGFGSATVNLNTVCSSVVMDLNLAEVALVQVDKDFHVQSIQANFEKLNIQTHLEGCNSVAGLQEEIQKQVVQLMKSAAFEAQLKQILTTEIAKQINLKIQSVAGYFVQDKPNSLKVKLSLDQQNKLWLHVGETAEGAFTAKEIAQLAASEVPSALIKKDELEKTLLKNLNAQIAKSPIVSTNNPSIERLTCSRWVQFFVWPALKAFPKCFAMQFVSRIKQLKLTDIQKLKFTVTSASWAQAKEPLKNIAYFYLTTDIALNSNKVKIKSITGQHYPEFLKWSGRSSRISTGLVTSTMEDYLQAQIAMAIKGNEMLNPANIKNVKLISPETLFVQLK